MTKIFDPYATQKKLYEMGRSLVSPAELAYAHCLAVGEERMTFTAELLLQTDKYAKLRTKLDQTIFGQCYPQAAKRLMEKYRDIHSHTCGEPLTINH